MRYMQYTLNPVVMAIKLLTIIVPIDSLRTSYSYKRVPPVRLASLFPGSSPWLLDLLLSSNLVHKDGYVAI